MKWSHDRNVSGSKFNLVWPFMCSVKVKKDNIRIRMVTAIVWYNNKINDLLSVEIPEYNTQQNFIFLHLSYNYSHFKLIGKDKW
jgi:hypothetical protein